MRSIILSGLIALALSNVSCTDINEKVKMRRPLKGKRGIMDYSGGYSRQAYNTNHYAPTSGNFLGGHNIGGYGASSQVGYGTGYLLPQVQLGSNLGHGIGLLSGLGYGAGLASGGHGDTQFSSTIHAMNVGSSGSGLLLPTSLKNGPVTFDNANQGYKSPLYVTSSIPGGYKHGASSSQDVHSLLGSALFSSPKVIYSPPAQQSSSSVYNHPTTSDSSSSVTGGLFISGATHGSSSGYSVPMASSHGYSTPLSQTSYSHSSPSSHIGLSSGSSDSSSYSLPISSSSYPVSSSTSGKYAPISSSGSLYATNHVPSSSKYSVSSAGYSQPSSSYSSTNVNYATPVSSYSSSIKNSVPSTSSYSSPDSSHSNLQVTYSGPSYQQGSSSSSYSSNIISKYPSSSSTYSSPSTSYSSSGSSYPSSSSSHLKSYTSPTNTYTASSEPIGSYTNVVPQYVSYSADKSEDNIGHSNTKYDTISYSSVNGKY